MGGSSSTSQSPKTIRTNTSYYGGNGELGEIDDNNLEGTLRDLHLERLYQRAPELRPSTGEIATNVPVKLKTVVSVTSPDPYIKNNNGVSELAFGLKTEAPCRIVLIANNLINSLACPLSDNRLVLNIPLPAISDFVLEITPDLENQQPVREGYLPVLKHVYVFKLVELGGEFRIQYIEQQLYTEQQMFRVEINKQLQLVVQNPDDNCMVCQQLKAEVAIAECGHKIICDDCLCNHKVRFHHCPICNAPTTF